MKITNTHVTIPSIALVVIVVLASGTAHLIVKIVKCRCIVHDPITIQNVTCWSKSINRTYSLTNLRGNITRALHNVTVNLEIFRRTDIKYRPFLVNITEDYCAFFAQNKASIYFRIAKSIYLPYTNLNHTCQYFAGNLIIIVRSECMVHDPRVIHNVSCWARPFNRSVSVANMRANLVHMINNILINVQLYKRSEDKFRPFLVIVTEDCCQLMAKKSQGQYLRMLTPIYLTYTSLNHTCRDIGHVYIKHLPLDANYNLPALWAVGEYRLFILLICDRKKTVTIEYYFESKGKPHSRRM